MTFCYQDMLIDEEIDHLKNLKLSKEDLKFFLQEIESDLDDLFSKEDRLQIQRAAVEILLEKSK